MPAFSGIDHVSLSVTDLDRSERFYSGVLEFTPIVDFGYARLLLHKPTGFGLALVRHEAGHGLPFTELNAGLDHLGLTASSRDELVEWERRLDEHGVVYTPIRDMEFGYHLNFRDPDNIPLEFYAPNDVMASWLAELKTRDIPAEEINARIVEHLATLEAGR